MEVPDIRVPTIQAKGDMPFRNGFIIVINIYTHIDTHTQISVYICIHIYIYILDIVPYYIYNIARHLRFL